MRLIQFQWKNQRRWGAYAPEGHCLDFTEVSGCSDLRAYLGAVRRTGLDDLAAQCLRKDLRIPASEVELLAPVSPGTLFGVGCNFKATSRRQQRPILFLKAIRSIIATQQPIRLPPFVEEVVAEVELGLVMDADESVFGYTVVNDVTARGLSDEDIWFYRKSIATFTPVGPWVVTADEVPDPARLDLFLELNGRNLLRASTAEMLFGTDAVIAAITRNVRLAAGDLIMMGCPGTPGALRHGDRVRAGVDHLGVLENSVTCLHA